MQNNVRGEFIVNDLLAHFVAVEADSLEEANKKGNEIFTYDYCPCCGERWYKDDGWFDDEGKPVERIEDLIVFSKLFLMKSEDLKPTELRIHRKNGIVESYAVLNKNGEPIKLKSLSQQG